jgi:hypothetical protein
MRADGVVGRVGEKLGHIKLISPWIEGAWDGDPEAIANARLIAAAPEMLAALRLVVGLADNEAVESGDCRNPDNPFAIARAAIAKATT